MPDDTAFVPHWASPPSRTIRAALEAKGLEPGDLSSLLEIDAATSTALLEDRLSISGDVAAKLAAGLGASPKFWAKRFSQFIEDEARLAADRWAKSAPSELSTTFGWIPKSEHWTERIEILFEFFGVPDLETWNAKYEAVVSGARYRTSPAFESNSIAVAAWLRRGQQQAESMNLEEFDRERFLGSVPEIRKLTWIPDPGRFLPRLAGICAASGVAVGLVRAPSRCYASGAALLTESGQPMILLSGRHRSDDHLWFSFFHEAAHVLFDDLSVARVDTLEPDDRRRTEDVSEVRANEWAAEQIVPTNMRERAYTGSIRQTRPMVRLAQECGVAPGLVVGHLQHLSILEQNRLNRLKRRYRWNGLNLERA